MSEKTTCPSCSKSDVIDQIAVTVGEIRKHQDNIQTRLFVDNGTISVQTKIDRLVVEADRRKSQTRALWGLISALTVVVVGAVIERIFKGR